MGSSSFRRRILKDRASLSLAPSKRNIGEHSRRNAKGCVHSRNMGGIDVPLQEVGADSS